MKKFILAFLISITFFNSNSQAAIIFNGIPFYSVVTKLLAVGGVFEGVLILENRDKFEDGTQAGLTFIIGSILLDNKTNSLALTKDDLGIDPAPLQGYFINLKLSANQLYHDLEIQRDQRRSDLTNGELAELADHLNGKHIQEILQNKIEQI
jgi:hypothetical protein